MLSFTKLLKETSWYPYLKEELNKDYIQKLEIFLDQVYQTHEVFPQEENLFNAFITTPLDQVKVVLLGQDPYHQPGQAQGLSFSVPKGMRLPPSLQNIFKAIHADLGLLYSDNGDLKRWAQQGVFLLNTVLSVEKGRPRSHSQKGWETFTDQCIRILSSQCSHLVFLLWGNDAQTKEELIDPDRHLILKTTHPSPFSAHRGFMTARHFSQTNDYLAAHGKNPVDWS